MRPIDPLNNTSPTNAILAGRVLETELQKLLLAKEDKEYAFKIVDHAQPPRLRYWPKRLLVVAAATVLGFVGAAFFVVYRHIYRRDRSAGALGLPP